MAEDNVISDVRDAKKWLDTQFVSFREIAARLAAVEEAYRNRSGEFAAVPLTRPAAVQASIDSANTEPGRDLLEEARASRHP